MHIPENYLSPSTCAVLGAAMVPVWIHAGRRIREDVPRDKMPLLGVAAAFCFLAMMFNVPLPGGTTGHAVCGTLVAILFGPWAATIAISLALGIQAILFGDGGVLALGANCFNMAFVLPMVGYGIYRLVLGNRRGLGHELLAAGVGSYVGINAAALCAAVEFGIQPALFHNAAGQALYCPYPLSISVPAMMLGHLTVAGAAEVVFTTGILAYVRKVAPGFGLGDAAPAGAGQGHPRALAGLLLALVALTPLGLLATGDAWGEWATEDVASSVGYAPAGMSRGWEWSSLLPDYSLGGLPDWVGYLLSAAIGAGLLMVIFRALSAGSRRKVDFGAAR